MADRLLGIWAIDSWSPVQWALEGALRDKDANGDVVGDMFPEAQVLGIDLSPIQ